MKDRLEKYYLVRSHMKTGDLVEFSSATALGYAIRWFTKKKVNHTAFLLQLDEFLDLRDRRFVLEALEKGLEFNLLSDRLEHFKGKVYWSALKPEFDRYRNKMGSWAILKKSRKAKGKKIGYDYKSLFMNAATRVIQDAERLFCSEVYHIACAEVGILPGGLAARPGEFARFGIHEATIRIL